MTSRPSARCSPAVSRLSGGQRQRVAIAQALVARAKLLMLDEPLASLDLRSQREIVELLQRLHHDRDVTILVVAHDLNPVLNPLDSAIYLLDGQAHYDTINNVLDDPLLSRIYGIPIEVAPWSGSQITVFGRAPKTLAPTPTIRQTRPARRLHPACELPRRF